MSLIKKKNRFTSSNDITRVKWKQYHRWIPSLSKIRREKRMYFFWMMLSTLIDYVQAARYIYMLATFFASSNVHFSCFSVSNASVNMLCICMALCGACVCFVSKECIYSGFPASIASTKHANKCSGIFLSHPLCIHSPTHKLLLFGVSVSCVCVYVYMLSGFWTIKSMLYITPSA